MNLLPSGRQVSDGVHGTKWGEYPSLQTYEPEIKFHAKMVESFSYIPRRVEYSVLRLWGAKRFPSNDWNANFVARKSSALPAACRMGSLWENARRLKSANSESAL